MCKDAFWKSCDLSLEEFVKRFMGFIETSD